MTHFIPSSSFAAAGSHLRISGVSFSYPGRRVLTDVSFVVSAGERVGLVGENGSGKSTLLQVIAGALEPSVGEIITNARERESPKIGLLRQDAPFPQSATITESLDAATTRSREAAEAVSTIAADLTRKPEDQSMADAYAEALEAAERLGAWAIDARVAVMLTGLGLGDLDRHRSIASLSGGQRARLALACLLLSAPDVLLLDEPTNHLDDAASAYLVSVLKAWPGPVLIASHDRAFLDDAVNSVIDLDPMPLPHSLTGPLVQDGPGAGVGLARFSGNYSDYVRARAEANQRWERQYQEEQNELSRLRVAVKDQQTVGHTNWRARSEVRAAQKFYADRNAQVVSRRVNDSRARLAKLEERQIRKPPQKLAFRGFTAAGSPPAGTSETVLVAEDVTVAGRLAATSLSVSRGEKWLISGPNGSGKSTLLRLLAQTLSPSSGRIRSVPPERISLLAQETTLPDPHDRGPTRTALEAYVDLIGAERARQVPLDTFGLIAGRDHNTPVAKLSIGQQRRLALATVIADPPEILLLDEPTNHFSLELVTSLERAIRDYPGTVVIASHDRWLRETWSGQQLELHG